MLTIGCFRCSTSGSCSLSASLCSYLSPLLGPRLSTVRNGGTLDPRSVNFLEEVQSVAVLVDFLGEECGASVEAMQVNKGLGRYLPVESKAQTMVKGERESVRGAKRRA